MQAPQPSWFVYKPANDAQQRSGQFMLSPGEQQVYNSQMPFHPGMQFPNPYMQQPMHHQQQPLQPKPIYHAQMQTPVVSPQPQQMRNAMAVKQDQPLRPLDTNVYHRGSIYSPCTPPLSTSSSTVSSPPSTSMALSTPLNNHYMGFQPYEMVKESREADQYVESFAHADWSRTGSPPMTPGELHIFNFHVSAVITLVRGEKRDRGKLGTKRPKKNHNEEKKARQANLKTVEPRVNFRDPN